MRAGISFAAPAMVLLFLAAAQGAEPEQVFSLSIENRKLAGDVKVIRVKQGDTVKINWTTDEPTEVHLHGYEMKKTLTPGETAPMVLKARATGRFSIVSHGFGKSRGKHSEEIPLFYLEVHPR